MIARMNIGILIACMGLAVGMALFVSVGALAGIVCFVVASMLARAVAGDMQAATRAINEGYRESRQ